MLDRPWDRVKDPTPIPARLSESTLVEMAEDGFATLLRDNLLPRQDRAAWRELWDLLDGDDDLADRALDVLEDFERQTSRHLAEEADDERDRARATKFLQVLSQALSRLDNDSQEGRRRDEPLAWAGRRAERFNPLGRRVIEQLVFAVDQHRAQVGEREARPEDLELWRVLGEIRFDPSRNGRP